MSNPILDEVSLKEVVEHFQVNDLLNILGFDEDLCFYSDKEVADYVIENADYIEIPLKPEFRYQSDQEVYDRVVELLEKDKLTYSDWDDFLKKYE